MMFYSTNLCWGGGGGGGGGQVVNEYLLYLLQTNIFICRVKLNLDVTVTVIILPDCRKISIL